MTQELDADSKVLEERHDEEIDLLQAKLDQLKKNRKVLPQFAVRTILGSFVFLHRKSLIFFWQRSDLFCHFFHINPQTVKSSLFQASQPSYHKAFLVQLRVFIAFLAILSTLFS